jgi:hypothetical protein
VHQQAVGWELLLCSVCRHSHTHTQCQIPVKSSSLYHCELHCSVLGRHLSLLQSVPAAHNHFSFIAVSSINQYVKIIIKFSNVIIHMQTGVYLDLSLCVQVEHMRKICVCWCIVHSSTVYIRGLLIKRVYGNAQHVSHFSCWSKWVLMFVSSTMHWIRVFRNLVKFCWPCKHAPFRWLHCVITE